MYFITLDFPSALRNLIESDFVVKTGLNIHGDALKLHRYVFSSNSPHRKHTETLYFYCRDFDIRMRRYAELNDLATLALPKTEFTPKRYSLELLTQLMVRFSITQCHYFIYFFHIYNIVIFGGISLNN